MSTEQHFIYFFTPEKLQISFFPYANRLFGDDESTTFSQYINQTFGNLSLGQAIDELVTCFSPLTKAENLLDLSLIKCFMW